MAKKNKNVDTHKRELNTSDSLLKGPFPKRYMRSPKNGAARSFQKNDHSTSTGIPSTEGRQEVSKIKGNFPLTQSEAFESLQRYTFNLPLKHCC